MKRYYDDWIKAFVEFTEDTEPPLLYKKWVAISAIAGVLQRKCFIEWEGHLYPNMYIILVGPPGARKGTILRYGRLFLDKLGVERSSDSPTREALIRQLNETNIQTIIGKETIFHSSLTIMSPELSVFLGQTDTRIIRDLTDWFDCADSWKYDTKDKKKKDHISNLFINLIGATQPETLGDILPREVISGGLASRIIFVFANKKYKIVPIPIPYDRDIFDKLHADLNRISVLKGEFKTSEKFLDLITEWTYKHEANPLFHGTLLSTYSDRRRIHIIKLAMICNASRCDDMVLTDIDFNTALDLMLDCEKYMLEAFRSVGNNPLKEVLPGVISILASTKEITFSELLQRTKHDCDDTVLAQVIAYLTKLKSVKMEPIKKDNTVIDHKIIYIFKKDREENA